MLRVNSLISIITPVFNGEAVLRHCVESIAAAAEGFSLELIIVDDGSTDGTPEIARELAATWPWIRYIRQQNGGPSSARNAALELAQGGYIGFVDADDCVAPSYVATLMEVCADSPDIVVFGYQRVLQDGPVTVKSPAPMRHIGDGERLLEKVSTDREIFWYSTTKLFRADLVEGARFDERIRLGEDTIFNMQAIARARVVVRIPDVLYYYHETSGSLSSPTFKPGLLENMEAHFAGRLRVHEQLGQKVVGAIREDICQYYLGHVVPWLISNAMRANEQDQLGELARAREANFVAACFAWGGKVRGSRGLAVMLLLFRLRLLRLLRNLMARRQATVRDAIAGGGA